MTKQLKKLLNDLGRQETRISDETGKKDQIKTSIVTELGKQFEKDKTILAGRIALENSNNYGEDENGWIYAWARFELPEKFKPYTEYFERWIQEQYCYTYDSKNDSLMNSLGPDEIVINEDGDIFMGHKVIIDSKECRDDDGNYDRKKRNRLIEEYMERTGYFPGVFKQDHYGNITAINTKEEK